MPGQIVTWTEDSSNWDDPMSGPGTPELVWPDWAQVGSAIDRTREHGWLICTNRQPWSNARNAPMGLTRYVLEGRAPLPVRESPGPSTPTEGGLAFPLPAPIPEPTPEQLALPETERMIEFLVAVGGGGSPVENAARWNLRHVGAPNGGDARPWRAMVAELERRGYRVDWWPGAGGMGWVRLATLPPVTVMEAAQILGLSYPGAHDLLRRRELRPIDHVGRTRRYDRGAILALAAEVRRGGRPRLSQPFVGDE
jgi:hypothetical protein